MSNDRVIELLDYDGDSNLMSNLYNDADDQYYIPVPAGDIQNYKDIVTGIQSFLSKRKTSIEAEKDTIRVGIIDSGLLSDHPLIKPFLEFSNDFTGEGEEDIIGHGTMVALVLVIGFAQNHDLLNRLRLVNIKVIPKNEKGEEKKLVRAINWCHEAKLNAVNISLGTYNKKFGIIPCNGKCALCLEAERLAKTGVKVYVAAGNIAGITSCPAKIGLLKPECGVICVGSNDFSESGKAATYEPSRQAIIKWPIG